ncbi:hypothetical protein JCM11251_002498 [Rhodosporidiobolus azoricus]
MASRVLLPPYQAVPSDAYHPASILDKPDVPAAQVPRELEELARLIMGEKDAVRKLEKQMPDDNHRAQLLRGYLQHIEIARAKLFVYTILEEVETVRDLRGFIAAQIKADERFEEREEGGGNWSIAAQYNNNHSARQYALSLRHTHLVRLERLVPPSGDTRLSTRRCGAIAREFGLGISPRVLEPLHE